MKQIPQTFTSTKWHIIVLTAIAVVAFMPWLGSVHLFDWDEINFAEAAREMLVTGEYGHVQINFEPFYEKPPLFFWLQALIMKVWGINEFAARFPNALFGVFTLLTLYLIGKGEVNGRFGLLWGLMHASALLPHFYFKTGIIDPVFNYFIFVGIYSLVKLLDKQVTSIKAWSWVGGLSIGLAILTKGPVGVLIPAVVGVVYCIKNRLNPLISWYQLTILAAAATILPIVWLGYETYYHGGGFIKNFTGYQIELFNQPVAGHDQPFYYHLVVVFLGCFPASVLGIGDLLKPGPRDKSSTSSWMKILLGVVMLLFSLATTKIVHYSSMAYFPISFLAARYLYQLDQQIIVASKAMEVALWVTGCLVAAVLTALPLVALHKDWLYPFITDGFTLASLQMPVPWSIQDCMVGLVYLSLSLVASYFFNKRIIFSFAGGCVVATSCCLALGTVLIIPKIEAYTQRPAIEFYKSLVGKPVYVTTVGFKSYAPLFYFQQLPGQPPLTKDINWLLAGPIDKPAYFVVKIDHIACMEAYPSIALLDVKGGFAFYKRDNLPTYK